MTDHTNMTKKEAIQEMEKGEKLSHYLFANDEWITVKDGRYHFEDGCSCSFTEFWDFRQSHSWTHGWKIYNGGA